MACASELTAEDPWAVSFRAFVAACGEGSSWRHKDINRQSFTPSSSPWDFDAGPRPTAHARRAILCQLRGPSPRAATCNGSDIQPIDHSCKLILSTNAKQSRLLRCPQAPQFVVRAVALRQRWLQVAVAIVQAVAVLLLLLVVLL